VGDLLHLHNEHDRARLLLPWYVNGTLEPEDTALFETHLNDCDECRADLAANRALRELYAATPVAGLAARPAQLTPARGSPQPMWRLSSGWARVTQVALAAAAAVALIVVVAPRPEDSGYRLLGSDDAVQVGNAIVLFSPDTTERDLRAALTRAGARLVDGPTASGAYVVLVPEQRRAEALADLRALPQVVLAEPVDAAGGP
jgi:hypothetical protein